MALTAAQQQQVADDVAWIRKYTQLIYEQFAGPIQSDGYGHGWSQLGTNAEGQNLTNTDALGVTKDEVAAIKQDVAAIKLKLSA